MAVTKQEVAEVYVATYNRAPDAAGLDYWVNDSFDGDPTIDQIAMSFFDQPETQAKYPAGTTDSAFVTSIFQNLFGRDPDAAGLAYWIGDDALGGGMHRSVMIQAIKNGATGTDADIIANKAEVGLYYADLGLTSSFSLANVTDDSATVATAKTSIDSLAGQESPAFVLTTGVDDIQSTATDKTVVGIVDTNNSISTLNAGDRIVGTDVEGDTLRVILDATSYAGTATIIDIDSIQVQNGTAGARTFNTTGITGAKEILSSSSVDDLTISNLGSLDTKVGIKNSGQDLTANWQGSLLSGSADEITVVLDTATGGAGQTVTFNNGVEIVNLMTAGGASDINNITDATAGGAFTTLNVAAEANVRIRALDADVTTIDASESTANVFIGVGAGEDMTITGGAGDDRFSFGAGDFTADDVVDGGEGTDQLDLTLNANLASKNQITSIETITASAAGAAYTLNLEDNSDIETFVVREDGVNNSITLTNVEAPLAAVSYAGDTTATGQIFDNLTVNLAPGVGTGTADATAVSVGNSGTALGTGNAYALGTLTLPGIETVSISVADGNAAFTALSATAMKSLTLEASGNLDMGATLNSTVLSSLDASAVAGDLTVDTSTSNASVNITLGDGDNEVTVGDGDAATDITTITLGDGANIIDVNAIITGGSNFDSGVGGDVLDMTNNAYQAASAGDLAYATGTDRTYVINDGAANGQFAVTGSDEATLVADFITWAGGAGVTFDNALVAVDSGSIVVVEGNDNSSYVFNLQALDATAGITAGDTIQLVAVLADADASDMYVGNFI